MANVLVYKVTFLKNYLSYMASDVIEVYVDEASIVSHNVIGILSTSGLTAYKNGAVITSGAPISYSNTDSISVQDFDVSFCFGTEFVQFVRQTNFPYVGYYTEPNSVKCGATPTTCDLIIVGAPSITNASGATTSDGQIVVVATSSNAINYRLNDDFVYGDANAQGSGTFTGLLPGLYRIYVRDDKNCSANILVEVSYDADYQPLYELEYYDFAGIHTKLEIIERDYAGAVTEIKGDDIPVTYILTGGEQDYKFSPLFAGQVQIGLTSETDQQFIDLYTNDPQKYRVKYYKDLGAGYTLLFIGKLLPFLYSEEYAAPPYTITVTASDGLADLKDYAFVRNDGTRFYGTMKLIKIIAYCLSFTKLDLNIRMACNIYADGMNETAADDPFDQAYADTEAFYINQPEATVDFVLASVLEPFGARIVQWGGVWNVVRVEEMAATYAYREYDSDGVYVSNTTYNPVINVNYVEGGEVSFTGIPNLELRSGYGAVTVDYQLGFKDNILKNGDFRLATRFLSDEYRTVVNTDGWALYNQGYTLVQNYEVLDDNNVALVMNYPNTDPYELDNIGEAALYSFDNYTLKMGAANTLKITVRFKIETPFNVPLRYVKLRLKVKYGDQYLTQDGTWSFIDTIVTYYITKYNEYEEVDIIARQPEYGTPVDGMAFNVRVYHAHGYHADNTFVTGVKQIDTTSQDVNVLVSGTTTNIGNAYSATLGATVLTAGDAYLLTFNAANTGASTLNIDLLGVKDLKKDIDDALVTGDIVANEKYIVVYDGTKFQWKPATSKTVKSKTDFRDDTNTYKLYYYELESMTEEDDDYNIIRPNDYDANYNPVQWALKGLATLLSPQANFYVDFIRVKFQTNGSDPVKNIVKSKVAEPNNRLEMTRELYLGSTASQVEINGGVYFDYSKLIFGYYKLNEVKTNVISSELVHSGWLRDSAGSPYDLWTRDGKNEEGYLHEIFLDMLASQYNRSWRVLRCGLVTRTTNISPLNSYKEVNDSNRIYIPMSLSLDDRNSVAECELAEIGGDLLSARAHTSGFSSGYS